MIFLQGYPYSRGIGDFLNQLASFGFFSYLLPFLLIFALIFGILNSMKLFGKENKAVNGIIALVIGLMALQFDIVPVFFAEAFPRLGVGLGVILILLILAGFFIDPSKGWIMYVLLGIGVVVALVVLISTAGSLGWQSAFWWRANWPIVAGIVFILIVIGIIIGGSSDNPAVPYVLGPYRKD